MSMRTVHAACGVMAAILLSTVAPTSHATASEPEAAGSAAVALAEQLGLQPGGAVVGNRVYYDDGTVFVAVDAGVMSMGQCATGQFCV